MTAEIVMLSICGFFAFSIIHLQGRDWYESAVLMEIESDMLFREKMDSIFTVLWIAILFICLFCIIAVCLFRKMQTEDIAWILGVYLVIGYPRKKIKKMLMLDVGTDLVFSISFSYLLMNYIMKYLSKEPVLYTIISITGSPALYFLFHIINAVMLLVIIYMYDGQWLKKKMINGMVFMI